MSIYNLNPFHANEIRDAIENQIGDIEATLEKYKHVFKEEEIIRLNHCLTVRHEILDPILRILNGDEEKTGINFYEIPTCEQ
jgi:hypothetical protein